MKLNSHATPLPRTQAGATTLLMATVLLMAVSMIGVYSARSSVVEQRVAANTIWSQQTSDAAQSVRDNIATLKQTDLETLSGGASALTFTNDTGVSASTGVSKNHAAITVPTGMIYTANVTSADSFKTTDIDIKVTAANGVAEQRLYERASFGAFLKELPQGAITALGDATITTITNVKASPATKNAATIPKNAGICPKKAAMMAKTSNGVKATTTTTTSVAILTPPNGTDFVNMTPDQFEANFFSDSGPHLRETAQHYINCSSACGNSSVSGKTGFIWIEGDLVLDGITLGNGGNKAASAIDFGVDSTPVLLFVTGSLTMKNGAIVNGLIYTRGNWDNGANTGTVNGAVLVNGTGNGNGVGPNEAGNFNGSSGESVGNFPSFET